jgi:hypothetical protein
MNNFKQQLKKIEMKKINRSKGFKQKSLSKMIDFEAPESGLEPETL